MELCPTAPQNVVSQFWERWENAPHKDPQFSTRPPLNDGIFRTQSQNFNQLKTPTPSSFSSFIKGLSTAHERGTPVEAAVEAVVEASTASTTRRHHVGGVWADGSCREPSAQSGGRSSFRAVRRAVASRRPEHAEGRARKAVRSAREGEDVCSCTQASTTMVLTISPCTAV